MVLFDSLLFDVNVLHHHQIRKVCADDIHLVCSCRLVKLG